ncbi:MAG: hypothetical protein JW963_04860 [Anaerolineales bacterium]|nr:hypothetical protein [Anaerolineales bacterium]
MRKRILRRFRSIDSDPLGKYFLESEARKAILSHVQGQAPRVAYGLLAGESGRGIATYPLHNLLQSERSARGFLPDPNHRNEVLQNISQSGLEVSAIYQSINNNANPRVADLFAAWEVPPGVVYITVQAEANFRFRAFMIERDGVREIPIVGEAIEDTLDAIRRQFEINACLSLYTWIEAFNGCLHEGDWPGARQFLNEIQQGGYPLWAAAEQYINMKAREFEERMGVTVSPDALPNILDGETFLVRMLDDACFSIRRSAVLALRYLEYTQLLLTCLDHSDRAVQMLAAVALCHSDKEPGLVFQTTFNHPFWFIRWQAIRNFGAEKQVVDRTVLSNALRDSDVDVVSEAIHVLGQRGESELVANSSTSSPIALRDSNGKRLEL